MNKDILKVSIKDYKDAIKELQTQLLNLEQGTEEYRKVSEQLVATQKRLSDAMKGQDSSVKALDGSYQAMQNELSELTKQNKQLKDAMGENSDTFKANAERINELNTKLKEMDAQMGYYQRNVGDYKSSFLSAFSDMSKGPEGLANGLKTLGAETEATGGKLGTLKGASAAATQGIKQMTAASLRFIATPVGAAIAAIAAALLMLKKGISSSNENSDKFEKTMGRLKPILDVVQRLVEKFASALLDVIDPLVKFIADTKLLKAAMMPLQMTLTGVTKALELLGQGLGWVSEKMQPLIDNYKKFVKAIVDNPLGRALGLKDAVDEYEQLEKLEANIVKQRQFNEENERKAIEVNAKEEKKAADLRQKAYDRENYNAEQRKKYIQEYHKHQQQIIKNNLTLAKQQLNLAEMEAKKAGNTAETNKRLAEQRAEVVKLQAALSNDVTLMEKEMKAVNRELNRKDTSGSKDLYAKKLEWEKQLYEQRLENSKGNLLEEIQNAKKLEDTEYKIYKRKIQQEVTDRQLRNQLIEELEERHQKKLNEIGNKTAETYFQKMDDYAKVLEEGLKYYHKYSAAFDYLREKVIQTKKEVLDSKTSIHIGQWLNEGLDEDKRTIENYFIKIKDEIMRQVANTRTIEVVRQGLDINDPQVIKDVIKYADNIASNFIETFYQKFTSSNLPIAKFIQKEVNLASKEIQGIFDGIEESYKKGEISLEQVGGKVKALYDDNESYIVKLNKLFEKMTGLDPQIYSLQLEDFQKLKEEEKKESEMFYADLKRQADTNANELKALDDKEYADSSAYYKELTRIAFEYYEAIEKRGRKYNEDEEVYQARLLESRKAWYARIREEGIKTREETEKIEQEEYEKRVQSNLESKGVNPLTIGDTELEEAKASYEIAQSMLDEALQGKYETEEKWQERILELQKDARQKEKKLLKERLNMMFDFADSIGNLTGALGDYYMDEADRRREAAEANENLSDEERQKELETAKEAFETGKALQIVTTTISTLAGASGAFMRAVETYPAPYGAILGGIESAAALASGIATIKQIEAQRFDSGNSSSSLSNGSSQPLGTTFANAVPVIDETADLNSMERDTAVNEAASKDQRVYILQSDIHNSEKQVEVRQNTSTFK